ncbi:hypothetical protein B4N89_08140 [Embleya scabrispora]|uniref:Uncharacterized protein n=1 Tax=Embleya scabrispora TaxID=159449 RepID=A0A1T3NWA3_9ACTN|nr:hypothetical protein B4N89_08140 [Embleya scabrispora]
MGVAGVLGGWSRPALRSCPRTPGTADAVARPGPARTRLARGRRGARVAAAGWVGVAMGVVRGGRVDAGAASSPTYSALRTPSPAVVPFASGLRRGSRPWLARPLAVSAWGWGRAGVRGRMKRGGWELRQLWCGAGGPALVPPRGWMSRALTSTCRCQGVRARSRGCPRSLPWARVRGAGGSCDGGGPGGGACAGSSLHAAGGGCARPRRRDRESARRGMRSDCFSGGRVAVGVGRARERARP